MDLIKSTEDAAGFGDNRLGVFGAFLDSCFTRGLGCGLGFSHGFDFAFSRSWGSEVFAEALGVTRDTTVELLVFRLLLSP
jgi:hypothetical protein